jgi:glucosyl-dolichyl phosphate glucuronosyltransferase
METLLSVVVCTHQRAHHLATCLAALAALDDPVEVIVVDSASSPPVATTVDEFRTRLQWITYVYEPEAGLSRARNAGLHTATCEIVAFVDDDAAPEPDWARRLAAGFTSPAVACVGGSCKPVFEAARPSWMSNRLLALAGVSSFGSEARVVTASSEYPFGANIAFRRDALLAVGGFDPELGRIGRSLLSGEESAVVRELLECRFQVRLEPSAVVRHTVTAERLQSRYYSRRFFWQGVTRARMGTRKRRAGGLALEIPRYLASWVRTRDRYYLYRAGAETVGHLAQWSGRVR